MRLVLGSVFPLLVACDGHAARPDAGDATKDAPADAAGASDACCADAAVDGSAGGTITVTVAGPGRVTSTPPGIDCTEDGGACSHAFGTAPVVLATDAATTVRWSGDCTGNGDCVLAPGGDRAVTATTFAPLVRTFDDDDHGNDTCMAVAAGAGDAILVTGEIQRIVQGYDAWTRAYDAGGTVLWTYELMTPSEGEDRGNDVIGLPGGGAVVAGMWFSGSNSRRNAFLASLGATGAVTWLRESEMIGDDVYSGVARDASGALIVAGYRPDGAGGSQAWVRKLDALGLAEAWAFTRDGAVVGGFDEARAVAVDAAGNVIAVGNETVGPTDRDGWIEKRTATGGPIWSIPFASPGGMNDELVDVAVASDDSIAVVGHLGATAAIQVRTPTGALRWGVATAGGITWSAVAVDAARNVVVAGSLGTDLIVRKYDPAGALIWQRTFPGAAGHGVAVDSHGNVLACGERTVAGGKTDLLMMKLYQ